MKLCHKPRKRGDQADMVAEGKSLEEQRAQGLLTRLGPLFRYFFLDGFASGCLGIPLSMYMAIRVLNENPARMAMFALLSTLVYQVPRIPLAPIHGEVADRMPRKWLIYASKTFDIFCKLTEESRRGGELDPAPP